MPYLRRAAVFVALSLTLAARGPLSAQGPEPRYPRGAGHFAVLGGNVLFGALSAGVLQELRGGSFRDGFTRGALGGAVTYVGKRVAVERWDGAGLVGREVAAVGSSMVWNAAEGRGTFERVMLPIGPLHVYVQPRLSRPVHVKVDALSAGATLYALTRPELRFRAGESLSAGAAVFEAPEHRMESEGEPGAGFAYPGTILVSGPDTPTPAQRAETLAHERVHVIQVDQIFLALGRPAQDAVSDAIPLLRPLGRWVDLDFGSYGVSLLGELGGYYDRPWELEATFLEGR
jgi:hypothetical protein